MAKSLYWKVTLAIMAVAFTTAGLMAVFIRLTSADRLQRLIIEQRLTSLQQSLSDYYTEYGSWDNVQEDWQTIQVELAPTPNAPVDNPPQPGDSGRHFDGGQDRNNFLGLADAQGKVIVSVDPDFPDGSTIPADRLQSGTPVTVDGKQVGTILMARQPPGFNSPEAAFLQRSNQALIFAMLGALVVALIVGILLARTLVAPLHALTRATQKITQGQLDQQVKVTSNDEIGQLAVAFNRMSAEVARVNQMRRQMTADIAHDLRTPLTVISGYIESMRDGVLKPTPQRMDLIFSEIERLQTLVGDLRVLSLADAGELPLNPQPIKPYTLIDRAAALWRHLAEQKNITIEVEEDHDCQPIDVDEARMMQVMGNLISNSLRYTPPGGKIVLSTVNQCDGVEIRVQDTGEGIPAEELANIFNRFHRVDKSRHTESGESGLGLAIVKALVETHGGTASAESTPGQGTTISLRFPNREG